MHGNHDDHPTPARHRRKLEPAGPRASSTSGCPPTFTDEGLRAAIEIRSRWPGTPVLVLSQYVEERHATELLSSESNGVGYLLKQRVADVRDFLDALERVEHGGTALDPEVVAQLLLA